MDCLSTWRTKRPFCFQGHPKVIREIRFFPPFFHFITKLGMYYVVKYNQRENMTDYQSLVFHHYLNKFSYCSIFLSMPICLTRPFSHLFSPKEEVCIFFLCVFVLSLVQCSIMCNAPHKPAEAETPGPFLLYFLPFSPPTIVSSVPHKKEKGRWDLMEVIISESLACHPFLQHPTTHTSPSLYTLLLQHHHPTCIKEVGIEPSLSESPF